MVLRLIIYKLYQVKAPRNAKVLFLIVMNFRKLAWLRYLQCDADDELQRGSQVDDERGHHNYSAPSHMLFRIFSCESAACGLLSSVSDTLFVYIDYSAASLVWL